MCVCVYVCVCVCVRARACLHVFMYASAFVCMCVGMRAPAIVYVCVCVHPHACAYALFFFLAVWCAFFWISVLQNPNDLELVATLCVSFGDRPTHQRVVLKRSSKFGIVLKGLQQPHVSSVVANFPHCSLVNIMTDALP